MALDPNSLANELKASFLEIFEEMAAKAKDEDSAKDITEEYYAEKMSKVIADSVVAHIVDNGEITLNITNPANDAMVAAVPIAGDGGVGLQTTFLAYMATISTLAGKGTIS